MWNYIKSYAKFCYLAVNEELPHTKGYKPMTKIWRWFGYAVGAIGILTILGYLYPLVLKHPHISGGVFLSLVVVGLLVLIGFIKSFYDRTVDGLNDAHGTEISEWRTHTDKLYGLSIAYGMALQAEDSINFFRHPLPKETLTYLDANINNAIHNCLGTQSRDDYYEHVSPVPDSPDNQSWWIRSHCGMLEALIKHERQKQLATRKAASLIPKVRVNP